MDEEDDGTPRGPYVRVPLPDGQEIRATVRGREHAAGDWRYVCEIVLPDRLSAADVKPVRLQMGGLALVLTWEDGGSIRFVAGEMLLLGRRPA